MDWNATNYSRVSHWSERRGPTDSGNREIYIDSSTPGVYPGLAYELQFELCNRSQKTCWITLPMLADDDYFTRFAALAHQELDPSRLLIVELSNEPDGFWFRQSEDASAQGAKLGLPGAAPYYQGAAFTTYRTLQMATILRATLGDRVRVARCAVGNTDLLKASLASVYASSEWNPKAEVIDLLCMSAYFGSGRDGATYTLEQAKTDIDELVSGVDGFEQLDRLRKQYQIPLFGVYEGGVHVLKNAGTFSRSNAAGPALTYLLDRAASYFQYFNFYTDASTWPDSEGSGAWGLKSQIGGPETGKSAAVQAWIAAHTQH
jgi:hypothetical protein